MAWMSRSRNITYSSPCTSTSKRSSGLNSTVSPALTVRTCGPTATASAQVRRRLIWAVAGMRMPARERRPPSVGEICTMTRSKSTEIGCLSPLVSCFEVPTRLSPAFVVDVGTLARYRTNPPFQVRRHGSGGADGDPLRLHVGLCLADGELAPVEDRGRQD